MQRLQLGAPDFTYAMLSCLHESIQLIGDQNNCQHWGNCNYSQEKGDAHVSRATYSVETKKNYVDMPYIVIMEIRRSRRCQDVCCGTVQDVDWKQGQ